MKNFLLKICLAVALVIAFVLVSAKADKVTLKYNLTIGSTYKIKTVTDQVFEQTIMGQQQTIKNQMESITDFKVQGIEGNVIMLDTWYEKLKMALETTMGKIVMDSDTANNANPASKIFNKLTNKHFTVKMTPKGEIMDVIDADKIMEDALNGVSGMNEMQLSMLKESMKQLTGKEALRETLEMAMRCFPENSVNIGDTWTNQLKLASVMKAVINNTWKLTDRKDGVSFLEGKSNLKSEKDSAYQNMGGIPIKYNVTGEQQILSKIDEKTGWVIESTINQDISGEIIANLPTQNSEIQNFPIKIKSKIAITGIQ